MSFVEIDARTRDGEWSMSDLQSHGYFEIYCLLSGERRFFLEDRIYSISAPTVCIIPPFTLHKTEGGAYRRININIAPNAIDEALAENLYELGKSIVYRLDDKRAELFISLLEEAAKPTNSSPKQDCTAIHYAHVLISLLLKERLLPYGLSEKTSISKKDMSAMRAVSYINKHYNEDFSIEQLCKNVFVSKNSLCQSFRRLMHCSVMEYRTFTRLSKAKELLSSTKMGLDAIASECGFSSANYFSLIFKKEIGISPTGYRKMK